MRLLRTRHLFPRAGFRAVTLVVAAAPALTGATVSVVWRLFVSPLDVDRPDRLFVVRAVEKDGDASDLFSAPQYRAIHETDAFDRFDLTAAAGYQTVDVEASGDRQRATAAFVSQRYFEVLGRSMTRGRGFVPSDFSDNDGLPVAVISDSFWSSEFDRRSDAMGRRIRVGEIDVTIVGVAPPGVVGIRLDVAPVVFVPLPLVRVISAKGDQLWPRPASIRQAGAVTPADWLSIVVKLGATDTQIASEQALARVLTSPGGSLGNISTLTLAPLLDAAVPLTTRFKWSGASTVLVAAAIAIFVLGAATLALVALSDIEGRRSEMVTRLALGATRAQLAATMSAEVFVVGLWSSVLAFPLSSAILVTAAAWLVSEGPMFGHLELSLGVPGLAGILVGGFLASALGALATTVGGTRHTRSGALAAGRWTDSHLVAPRLRSGVVAVLASLGVALLGGAVFSVRAASRVMAVDFGYDADRVLYSDFDLRAYRYTDANAKQFVENALQDALLSPAISHAAVQFRTGGSAEALEVDGRMQKYPGKTFTVTAVSDSYFETINLPLQRGRSFGPSDTVHSEPVAIVSVSVARAIAERQAFSNPFDVIGHRVRVGFWDFRETTIIGVVNDWIEPTRNLAGLSIFIPVVQHPTPTRAIEMGLAGLMAFPTLVFAVNDVDAAKGAVPEVIRRIDPSVSPVDLSTARERMQRAFFVQDFASRVMSFFGVLAVVLAFVSLQVLVRSVVIAKRREMAIRSALGADQRRVIQWCLAAVGTPFAGAILLGSAGLWLWFNLISVYVVGIERGDIGLVIAILAFVYGSALASAIAVGVRTGWRSPADVLRHD